MAVELPTTVTLPLSEIKPYENNPRTISPEAVDAVKTSIENYGYVQPIVVDKDHVVIVGHTRLQALQALGVTEAPVYIFQGTEEQAREYRLIDNRTGELSQWDHKALILELREFEEPLLAAFFPDVDLEIGQLKDMDVTQEDVDKATEKVMSVKSATIAPLVTVECPSCFHNFKVKAASLPGLTAQDLAILEAKASVS
jgi:hypothetical protein